MKNIIKIYSLLFIAIVVSFCKKETTTSFNKIDITGYVQKGPFINGTNITISEVDANLSQTGKTFSTQIADNSGSFQVNNINLSSRYVLFAASGYYYNEIKGSTSIAPITLFAYSDISDKSNVNINILTNLEKRRVEYLISTGKSFSDSKKQAQSEILSIFKIKSPTIQNSEYLDISKNGEGNAILLAISAIFQGYRDEATVSELMANFSTDIALDGKLDSTATLQKLVNDASIFDSATIITNLKNRYASLNLTVSIPDFMKYVKQFVDSCGLKPNPIIDYPAKGGFGDNILNLGRDTFYNNVNYSMAANLSTNCSVKIFMKGGMWWYTAIPTPTNWTVSAYNFSDSSQTFTSTFNGEPCDLSIHFAADTSNSKSGNISIEYYENGNISPTRTKTLILK